MTNRTSTVSMPNRPRLVRDVRKVGGPKADAMAEAEIGTVVVVDEADVVLGADMVAIMAAGTMGDEDKSLIAGS